MSHSVQISRREERIYVSLPVILQTGWEGAAVVEASTIDYSESGLRVRADVPLRVRQEVEVVVRDNPMFAGSYTVVWVREASEGLSLHEAGLVVRPSWASSMAP